LKSAIRAHERVLRDLLRVLSIARDAIRESEQSVLKVRHEIFETPVEIGGEPFRQRVFRGHLRQIRLLPCGDHAQAGSVAFG
jgi:hypothetical protein